MSAVFQNAAYWFLASRFPLGPSRARQENERDLIRENTSKETPIYIFYNNTAHSYKKVGGLMMKYDNRIRSAVVRASARSAVGRAVIPGRVTPRYVK